MTDLSPRYYSALMLLSDKLFNLIASIDGVKTPSFEEFLKTCKGVEASRQASFMPQAKRRQTAVVKPPTTITVKSVDMLEACRT